MSESLLAIKFRAPLNSAWGRNGIEDECCKLPGGEQMGLHPRESAGQPRCQHPALVAPAPPLGLAAALGLMRDGAQHVFKIKTRVARFVVARA